MPRGRAAAPSRVRRDVVLAALAHGLLERVRRERGAAAALRAAGPRRRCRALPSAKVRPNSRLRKPPLTGCLSGRGRRGSGPQGRLRRGGRRGGGLRGGRRGSSAGSRRCCSGCGGWLGLRLGCVLMGRGGGSHRGSRRRGRSGRRRRCGGGGGGGSESRVRLSRRARDARRRPSAGSACPRREHELACRDERAARTGLLRRRGRLIVKTCGAARKLRRTRRASAAARYRRRGAAGLPAAAGPCPPPAR
jgi:hypothetical protein